MDIKDLFVEDRLTRIDIKDYQDIKAGMIKFHIECYDVKDFGRVSLLLGKMMGLMKMETLLFTPFYRDAPLLSYDLIQVLKKDTLIIELFDTCNTRKEYSALSSLKDSFKDLKDHKMKEAWYDSLLLKESLFKEGRKQTEEISKASLSYLKEYLSLFEKEEDIDPKRKKELHKNYVQGLLSNGGPSTDFFLKKLKETKTRELFLKYLFGVE